MYLGIDIHKRYAQVAVMDESGEIVEEVRVENANLDELAQRYAGAEAAIEATANYYHIRDTLSEHLDVTIANPEKLKLIANSDKKTDRVDAKELARMVRLSSVPESYVPPEELGSAVHSCAAGRSWSRTVPSTRTRSTVCSLITASRGR